MRRQRAQHAVLVMNEYVRMVVDRLRCLGDAVNERDGRGEVLASELTGDRLAVALPLGCLEFSTSAKFRLR